MGQHIENINLEGYTINELAEIYHIINIWEWHDCLGEKPLNWDNLPDYSFSKQHTLPTKKDIINPVARHIRSLIGEKETLRYLHVSKLSKSHYQFEYWWLKEKAKKFFKLGFYSKKGRKKLIKALSEVKDDNQKEWIKKTFEKQ